MGVGAARHFLWLVPALLLAGLVLVAGDAYLDDRLFAAQSVATQAVVTGKSTYQKGLAPLRYYLAFRFTTAAGQSIEGESRVEKSDWSKAQEQGPVAARYVPQRPSLNRLEAGRPELDPVGAGVMLLTCLAVLAAGILLFVYLK